MTRVVCSLLLAAIVAGCGGGSKPIQPLTDAEKAAIKAESQRVDDEEMAGSGKSTRKKK